uniref:Uncharacterized protein n=1 Tax=Solanum lycopersicum TaxID=4081 RepID=A0A3Q7FE47_SOLLC
MGGVKDEVRFELLLDMSTCELVKIFLSRPHKIFHPILKRNHMAFIKMLLNEKYEALASEKLEVVRTHMRNLVIFNHIELLPTCKHVRDGICATHSSMFSPFSSCFLVILVLFLNIILIERVYNWTH